MKNVRDVVGVTAVTVALAAGEVARAAVFHVTTAQELQTALTTAASNGEDDTILLAAGIHKGNFNFTTAQARGLTVKAEPGVAVGQVVLDGEAKGRVLNLDAGSTGANIEVQGLSLRNGGSSANGLGLHVRTLGSVVVADCHVLSNRFSSGSCNGGGVLIENAANVTFRANYVAGNRASTAGGVALVGVSNATITGNDVLENTGDCSSSAGGMDIAGIGTINISSNRVILNSVGPPDSWEMYGAGGIRVSGCNVLLFVRNLVRGNASSYGTVAGGMVIDDVGTVEFSDCTIDGNSAWDRGNYVVWVGGLLIRRCTVVFLNRNTFVGNTATAQQGTPGGGLRIELSNGEAATCSDNFFIDNASTNTRTSRMAKGGGLYCNLSGGTSTVVLVNNTFTGNAARNGGGAAFALAGGTEILRVYNNIVWGNNGTSGGDICVDGYGSSKLLYNNNFHDMSGVWDFAVSNIDVHPLFMDELNGDYRLRANSLCIDAGNNAAPGLPTTDKDGNPRIGDGVVDIGAYEHSRTDLHPADANANWIIEPAEFAAYATAWTNGAAWATGPSPIPMDYVTRAGYLLEKGGRYHNEGGGKPRNWKPGP